ncbi:MAG: ABC transporter permease subunit [Rhodospirillaceae bacterium]|nr:ABC transporter permease subunit [Rhodospirillaceae bacterium]
MAAETPVSSSAAPKRARRSMKTSKAVLIADKVADWTIRIGGLGVIAAVFGIMAFLAMVVVPLFTGASIDKAAVSDHAVTGGRPLMDVIDEYKTVSVSIDDTGKVNAFHITSGAVLDVATFDFGGKTLTAFARTLNGRDIAFGFADGTLRLATVKIGGAVINTSDAPADLKKLSDTDSTDGKAIYTAVSADQTRRVSIEVELAAEQQVAPAGTAIVAADYRMGGAAERPTISFVTIDAAGVGRLSRSESKSNMMTGVTTTSVTSSELPGLPHGVKVRNVLMTDKADQVYVIDAGGTVYRYDTREFDAPVLAETIDLLPDATTVGAVGFLIGEQSLVVSGSDGSVDVYFRLQAAGATTTDGYVMTRAHMLAPHTAPVVAMDASQRGKMFITADAKGEIWLRHSTSEQVLLRLKPNDTPSYRAIALAPRENSVLAVTEEGKVYTWDISAPHPESTLNTIFGKVWYEGYPEPGFTWQSSSGTDAFEPKFSLVPLIFGTIKATFYSLLFAIPIALGAAIYTSEFVHHRVRAVVKPTMELMASLPSVVLGFIAALILAPIVETWIAAIFFAFIVIPAGLFTAAYLWQLLPNPIALRYGGLPKFALIFAALGIFGYAAFLFGPVFESLFFAGDLKAWANGDVGSSVPFTAMIAFPFVFLALHLASDTLVTTHLGFILRGEDRTRAGLTDAVRWVMTLIAAGVVSYALAVALVAFGLDPRGGVVDTYVQRNTLVVGFAMGFAVIPIIYTIAEDALNTVPEHLRAASLACGATPWQTAISVIVPTAMSGIFSAIMVGMGRAVGETMIVVMAAGNTPVMEWNVFNGLRALSANIAVELSEAVRDSTLYRMLFLAALSLFVITFIVNTLAEVVRQRFRKRTAQL